MAQGTIKSFDDQKGYGFITDEAGKEYTFNQSSIGDIDTKALKEGVRVGFDVEAGARGLRAVRMKLL